MQIAIRLLTYLAHLSWVVVLTVLTQIGGVVHLVCLPFYGKISRRFPNRYRRIALQTLLFLGVYLGTVLLLVPVVAPMFGRVAMPLTHTDIRPHNWMTVLLCRHYVRPELRRLTEEVAIEMKRQHQSTLLYLDAQHPFYNGWPLLPHLSHSDGRKLDIALLWKDKRSGKPVTGTPSSIGYGVFEDPKPGEYNRTAECEQKGHWQYGYMSKLVSQGRKADFVLDEARTAAMTRLFCQHKKVRRVLIEPYLKKRLNLENLDNLRHAGCNAVRHDDHIHVELGAE